MIEQSHHLLVRIADVLNGLDLLHADIITQPFVGGFVPCRGAGMEGVDLRKAAVCNVFIVLFFFLSECDRENEYDCKVLN